MRAMFYTFCWRLLPFYQLVILESSSVNSPMSCQIDARYILESGSFVVVQCLIRINFSCAYLISHGQLF